jgi:periplasmic copper chaperone A
VKLVPHSLLRAGTGAVIGLGLAFGSVAAEGTSPDVTVSPVLTSDSDVEPGLQVTGAWAREAPMVALAGAAYLVVHNRGDADDAIVGASSPVAGAVELHRSSMDDEGMMSMSPVSEIPVPAHGDAVLEPGGYHIMLIDLVEPLVGDAEFELTLEFARAEAQTVTVPVMTEGPMDHSMGDLMDMAGGSMDPAGSMDPGTGAVDGSDEGAGEG